jgi:hypothetical protein
MVIFRVMVKLIILPMKTHFLSRAATVLTTFAAASLAHTQTTPAPLYPPPAATPSVPVSSIPATSAPTPAPAPATVIPTVPPATASVTAAADAATPVPQRDTLGVSDIKILPALLTEARRNGTASALERVAQSLDGQLIAALGATRKFQIVGRSDLDVILKEQSLSNSGTVDEATAVKIFKLAGATYILTVSIDNFQDRTETATFSALGEQAQRRKVTLSCIAKIYSAQSGKLLESANIQLDQTDARNDPNYIASNGSNWADKLLVDLARVASEKIAQRVTDSLYPAKVVAKTDKQITLNRGDGTGIAVGQTWIIYNVGKELIDPDTGLSLGREEVAIGKAKITSVTPRTALADLIEDRGVAPLNTARQSD